MDNVFDAVCKFADALLVADLNERRERFQRTIQARAAKLAADGISRSGAAHSMISDDCCAEIAARGNATQEAIQTAAAACDFGSGSNAARELARVFDRLFEDRWRDVQSTFDERARLIGVNPTMAIKKSEGRFAQTAMIAATKAHAQLAVFAARQWSRAKNERRETWVRLGYLIAGAALSRITDAFGFLAHLVQHAR